MKTKTMTLGWSRTKIDIEDDALVLDVGCGAFPNDAASIACDMSLEEDRHRTGRATTVDRPFVLCDASQLPFRDGAFDFVIASHIGEHVDDPATFCAELARVARRGYVETPSPLADYLLDEEYHQWRVGTDGDRIRFARKPQKGRVARALTDRFYRVFYAGREMGAPTYSLPGGIVGRVLGFLLYLVRGVLNRSGLMHMRFEFGPDRPLRWEVDETAHAERSVAIVERAPSSGFLEGDRRALDGVVATKVVTYPGWPSPRFLLELWRAIGATDSTYTFFASEHALFGAVFARLRRRRFVVAVGGYDVARVTSEGYGLPTSRRTRWVPRVVMRLAHRVLPMSESTLDESIAAGADPDRTTVLHLGVDDRWAEPTTDGDEERDLDLVVTVGYVDEVSWGRKGIDRFVDLARRDPSRRFVLVGRIAPAVLALHLDDPPPNLELAGYVADDDLRRLLRQAGTYAQLSWHEGFGVSMVEAMMAGCRPLISTVPALAEVTGGYGVVSESAAHDPAALERAIAEPVDRTAMSDWACSLTSIESRADGLVEALFTPAHQLAAETRKQIVSP